jgi:ketosteroid isomerase-like protein
LYQRICLTGGFAAGPGTATVLIAVIDAGFLLFNYLVGNKIMIMKRIAGIALLLLSICAAGQSNDEKEIRSILGKQTMAWNRGDVDAFMVGYWEDDSLMFIGKSGVTYGYKNTLANYKKNYPDAAAMGQLTFTLIQLKPLSKEYFHITGKWHLKRSIGDIGGHYTLLFRKINGRWVIIADHSS